MGTSLSQALCSVVAGDGWLRTGRGPTLRRLFGAYSNGDVWAVCRQFRRVDTARSGYVSYEELRQVVMVPEFQLLFIWDLFSHSNSLIEERDLLTMVCVFSSAKLAEKAKFLLTLFDGSGSGALTTSELNSLCSVVLGVLSRCTGVAVRSRTVATELGHELPRLLQGSLATAVGNGDAAADRLIGRTEIERLLPTIEATYQELPISGPPPAGALSPPDPDWGQSPSASLGVQDGARAAASPLSAAGGGASAARLLGRSASMPRITEAELAHFSLLQGDAEQAIKELEPVLSCCSQEAATPVACAATRNWMIIHNVCMPEISKDLSGFRHLFVKSISSALHIPSGSIEIVDLTKGSIVVEFLVRNSRCRDDQRSSRDLVVELAQELGDPQSSLRKGPFSKYAAGAELVSGQSRRTAGPLRALGDGSSPLCCDQASQKADLEAILVDVLVRVDGERNRVEAAERHRREALEELRRLDSFINDMHQLQEEHRVRQDKTYYAEEDYSVGEQDDLDGFAEELRQLREGAGRGQDLSDSGEINDTETANEEAEVEPASREERQLEDFTEDLVTTCLGDAGSAIRDRETEAMDAAAWARERDEEALNKEEMYELEAGRRDILHGM